MEVYAAVQVPIGGRRTVVDRRPVGTIAKTEQGWWLIVAMRVKMVVAVMMPVVVPILMPVLVLVVVAILAIVMPVLTAVLRFVIGHRS